MGHKFHGIELAQNSVIENAVLESLASDITATVAGRVYYNDIAKRFKSVYALPNDSLTIGEFAFVSDITAFKTKLLSFLPGDGATLISYAGNETNTSYQVDQRSVSAALTSIIDNINHVIEDIANHVIEVASTASGSGSALIGYDGFSGSATTFAAGNLQDTLDAVGSKFDSIDVGFNSLIGSLPGSFLNKLDPAIQSVISDVDFTGNVKVANLTVTGTTTTVNSETVAIADNIMLLNSDVITGLPSENAGLSVSRGDSGALDFLLWNETLKGVTIAEDDGIGGIAQRQVATIIATNALISTATSTINGNLASTSITNGTALIGYNGKTVGTTVVTQGTLANALTEIITAIEAGKSGATTVTDTILADLVVIRGLMGLSTPTTFPSLASTNYLTAETTLFGMAVKLDGEVKIVADAVSTEQGRATTAEGVLQANIDGVTGAINTETGRATGAEAAISSTLTSELTRLEGLITAAGTDGAAAAQLVKDGVNASTATFASAGPSLVHTVNHGLTSDFINFLVMVKGDDTVFRNDIVLVEEIDNDSLKVYLSESRDIKMSLHRLDNIA